MCGVFGYVGEETDVGSAVLTALKTLEYRGYDSWGLAISTPDQLLVEKEIGRINGQLRAYPHSTLGIGHTRWATHGGVVAANAHPHVDCSGRIAVVHNGIIENHAQLRSALEARGHCLQSDTDSDVVGHLVEEELAAGHDLGTAVSRVFARLDGYNAIVVMDRLQQRFAAVKRISPLVLGKGSHGSTVASDAIALHGHADELIYLEDDQLAVLHPQGVDLFDRSSMEPISPTAVALIGPKEETGLGRFPDFLSKEVSEQPAALRQLVEHGIDEIRDLAAAVGDSRQVIFVGCGTAGNAAMAGSYLFSEIAGREAVVIPASEFRYRSSTIDRDTLVVAISQSGETVDVLEAVSEANRRDAKIAAIVNTPRSTLDRAVDTRVLLRTGVEQCVLATKSYTAMLATLLMTAHAVAGQALAGVQAVLSAADAIEELLENGVRDQIRGIATLVARSEHLFVIGRGMHYPAALEAALKIKEVSYIHAEGFAAGELKHGVIALVEPGTPCLVLAPSDCTRTDILSGSAELKSRGGHIIGVGSSNDSIFDDFVWIQDTGIANLIVEAVPGQLLGYFSALERGNDPDRPRNLAKSVTVK